MIDTLYKARIMPVIVIDRVEDAWPLAQALKAGGLPVAEVTFRTTAAVEAIRAISKDKEIALGAGTILQPDQVDQARDAGASYIVTPGFNPKVVRRCRDLDLPIFPGIATPTEIQMALDEGVETVKFFPAESLGGIKALRAMAAPYSMMRFIPTGGITLEKLPEYLEFPCVLAVGGSWMVAPELLKTKNFNEVTRLAAQAVASVQSKASTDKPKS